MQSERALMQAALDDMAAIHTINGQESIDQLTCKCPHCGVAACFFEISAMNADNGGQIPAIHINVQKYSRVIQTFCPSCRGMAIIVSAVSVNDGRYMFKLLWPQENPSFRLPPNVDPEVEVDFRESQAVFSASPRASAVLSRRCIQHILRRKLSVKDTTLFKEIEAVKDDERLSLLTRKMLHHVRAIGNVGAHPEYDEANTILEVTRGQAMYTLRAVQQIIYDLYILPEEFDRMEAQLRDH